MSLILRFSYYFHVLKVVTDCAGVYPGVRDDKRTIVVDEFDHPRRLSFRGWHNRKSSCRSEDSVESALKKLNI